MNDTSTSPARKRFAAQTQGEPRSAADILRTVGEMLAERFGASRVTFTSIDAEGKRSTLLHQWLAAGQQESAAEQRVADFLSGDLAADLLSGKSLVAADVRADERFAHHGAGFERFGAVSFVITPYAAEARVGFVMSVLKAEPYEWRADEIALLREVAEKVYLRYERAKNEAFARSHELELQQMADAMPQVVWIADAEGKATYYNRRVEAFAKVESAGGGRFDRQMSVHPDDLESTKRAWERAVSESGGYEHEHRILMADGTYRWHLSRAVPVSNNGPGSQKWYGTATDIHDMKQVRGAVAASEEKYRTLFESIDEGFCLLEILFDESGEAYDYVFLESNPAFERQCGLADAVGRSILELVPGLEPQWAGVYGQVAKTGEPIRFEADVRSMDRVFDIYAFSSGGIGENKVAVVFNDISERKRREANLAFLAEVSDDLARLTNIDETMDALGAKICGYFDAGRCIFVEIHEAEDRAVVSHEWHDAEFTSIKVEFKLTDMLSDEFMRLSRAGKAFAIDDVRTASLLESDRVRETFEFEAAIVVPLLRNGEWLFSVGLHNKKPREWREDEIDLMRELATRIWTRLERARAEEALRESEERLRVALSAGKFGNWQLDLATMSLETSAGCKANFGRGAGEAFTYEMFRDSIHPDDRERVAEAVGRSVESVGDYEADYRCIWPDGSVHWINARGRAVAGEDGSAVRLAGVTLDTTERELAGEALRRHTDEVMRFNRVAVGREMRMIDLKKEVNELRAKLGEGKPYPLDFE